MITQENIPYTADEIMAMVKTCEKYNKARERASKLKVQNPFDTVGQMVEHIFPELAQSEERIRKAIISCCIDHGHKYGYLGVSMEEMCAWLEKQSKDKPHGQRKECEDCQFNYAGECKGFCQMKRDEQKPADNVEPKFKEGDYIVSDNITSSEIWRVINIDKDNYYNIKCITNPEYDEIYRIPGFVLEKDYRLWTIEDTKRGDVLVDVYGNIGIFDKCYDFDWMSCCSLGNNGGFQYFTVEHENEKTYPATKEQRNLLFQKMKEEGWEWNSEKKELKRNL